MSSDDPTKQRFGNRCWAWLTNTRNAHIVAAWMLGMFFLASLALLGNAHMQQEQKQDSTTTEALFHFIVEIGIPIGVCIALVARICSKKPRTPKFNVLAPAAIAALIALCLIAFCSVWSICDGIDYIATVETPGGRPQTQPATLEIAEGINRLCTWSAPAFAFLLGLEVWASSK